MNKESVKRGELFTKSALEHAERNGWTGHTVGWLERRLAREKAKAARKKV